MQITKSRVLVTGGAGFIGSHLVDRLLSAGNDVTVIDDFSTGSRKNLAHHDSNPRLTIAEMDIMDLDSVMRVTEGIDFVFHMACRNVRLSLRQPTIVHDVNATGTLNTLKAAAKAKVKRYLYCSSSEVNGTADIVPMPEEYHFKPETIYGASKLTGEYYTQVFQRSNWLSTVIVRPHNNYGPREHYEGISGEVIPRFILAAFSGNSPVVYGDGLQTRDFTYVLETADYLVRLLECEKAVGETVNLCYGSETSILSIAEHIREMVTPDLELQFAPHRPNDVLRLYGDNSTLKRLLGDAPKVDIRKGLEQTIAWFRENVPLTPAVLESMSPENWEDVSPEAWLETLDSK